MESGRKTEEELRDIVRNSFPDIEADSFTTIDTGWENYVAIVGRKYAVKIPRAPEYGPGLMEEYRILECLADSPLPVPAPIHFSDSSGTPAALLGYIDGLPLNSTKHLSPEMVNQLASLLNYLYRKRGDSCLYSTRRFQSAVDWKNRYLELREAAFSSIYDALDDDVLSMLASRFTDFIGTYCSTLEPSPVHGDLYRGNVLISSQSNTITGILDWGTAMPGDPAIDFAALCVDFSISEVDNIISAYEGEMDIHFRKRIEFYWQIEPLYGLTYFRNSDLRLFEAKKEELAKKLDSGLI